MCSDQCGFPVFCCEKPLEEQATSIKYQDVEQESQDHKFGQVSSRQQIIDQYLQTDHFKTTMHRATFIQLRPAYTAPCKEQQLYFQVLSCLSTWTQINSTRSTLKATVILLPVLGLTWVFGVLTMDHNTTVFAWLFTIFNSLQVCVQCYLEMEVLYTNYSGSASVEQQCQTFKTSFWKRQL